ncbi:hypothetical protein MMC30_004089 [Trapelia coarctata]|nr:hypothetical protein [Trapelia coarctata]
MTRHPEFNLERSNRQQSGQDCHDLARDQTAIGHTDMNFSSMFNEHGFGVHKADINVTSRFIRTSGTRLFRIACFLILEFHKRATSIVVAQSPCAVPSQRLPCLPYTSTFRDIEHFVTAIGIGLLEQKEKTEALVKSVKSFQCQLRVLKLSAGTDKEYLGLLRLGDDFPYRIEDSDRLRLYFERNKHPSDDAFTWSAEVLRDEFRYAYSTDRAIVFDRPMVKTDEGHKGDETTPRHVLDLSELRAEEDHKTIYDFCLDRPSTPVLVKVNYSHKPIKQILRPLSLINPHHKKGENTIVPMWNRLLLGQDLRVHERKNIFGDEFEPYKQSKK